MIDIRDAEPGDYDAYARLLPELGTGDPVPSRERFADLCDRMLVATGDGAVVGYALFELLADVGYVRNLVSDRARRREGIGAALLEAMRARFVAAGARTWCLNVRPGNHAAIALYRRFGFTAAYGSYMLRVPRHAAVAPVAGLVYDPITPEEEPGRGGRPARVRPRRLAPRAGRRRGSRRLARRPARRRRRDPPRHRAHARRYRDAAARSIALTMRTIDDSSRASARGPLAPSSCVWP